jgi:hypothetical protein
VRPVKDLSHRGERRLVVVGLVEVDRLLALIEPGVEGVPHTAVVSTTT